MPYYIRAKGTIILTTTQVCVCVREFGSCFANLGFGVSECRVSGFRFQLLGGFRISGFRVRRVLGYHVVPAFWELVSLQDPEEP